MQAVSLSGLSGGQSTCVVTAGVRKIQTTYPNGDKLIEEYDAKSDELTSRRWCRKTRLGASQPWEYEVGENPDEGANVNRDMIVISSSMPKLYRVDKPTRFIYRVRNLPYPSNVYDVTVVPNKLGEIVIRTTNKKYYKVIPIPDIDRAVKAATLAGAPIRPSTSSSSSSSSSSTPPQVGPEGSDDNSTTLLDSTSLRISHSNNTLVIEIDKPMVVLRAEKARLEEIKQIKSVI